jgi:excisionase family DNA binding protein
VPRTVTAATPLPLGQSSIPSQLSADGLLARLLTYDRALTAPEVAALLCVNKATIYRLCDQREIPHFRLGKLTRFLPSKIAEWLVAKQAIVAVRTMLLNEERADRRRPGRRAT